MYVHIINTREKYSEEEIQYQIKQIAYQINTDLLKDKSSIKKHIVVLCILKGAVPFCSDLLKYLDKVPVYIDYIQLSSYNGGISSTGNIELKKDITLDSLIINNASDVFIIEDIIDSGYTMYWLTNYLKSKYTINSLKIVTLINKTFRRKYNININYFGFEDNTTDFLVGYGLDYNEFMRNTNNILEVIQ